MASWHPHLYDKVEAICSDSINKNKEIQIITNTFRKNRYLEYLLEKVRKPNVKSNRPETEPKAIATISSISGFSEKIRICRISLGQNQKILSNKPKTVSTTFHVSAENYTLGKLVHLMIMFKEHKKICRQGETDKKGTTNNEGYIYLHYF